MKKYDIATKRKAYLKLYKHKKNFKECEYKNQVKIVEFCFDNLDVMDFSLKKNEDVLKIKENNMMMYISYLYADYTTNKFKEKKLNEGYDLIEWSVRADKLYDEIYMERVFFIEGMIKQLLGGAELDVMKIFKRYPHHEGAALDKTVDFIKTLDDKTKLELISQGFNNDYVLENSIFPEKSLEVVKTIKPNVNNDKLLANIYFRGKDFYSRLNVFKERGVSFEQEILNRMTNSMRETILNENQIKTR